MDKNLHFWISGTFCRYRIK